MELLADATEAKIKNPFFFAFFYDSDLEQTFSQVIVQDIAKEYFKDKRFHKFLSQIASEDSQDVGHSEEP